LRRGYGNAVRSTNPIAKETAAVLSRFGIEQRVPAE